MRVQGWTETIKTFSATPAILEISPSAACRSSTYSRTQETKTTAESSSTPWIGPWVMSATMVTGQAGQPFLSIHTSPQP
ncbi:MAG: hypothetical protein IPK80_29055 [Nannocystis sp.]|nr:hypothetical protein [Nannocystis sp.]